ncbi:hypothetical protein CDAR_56211 [Caerostris darwini]|uniref:Uncharacterized protein n=1 Tax=Caerostris darwini TaxID=1538125 RepID=A0AAV4RQK8_9ARAC|nr:hypothetical protein CDAR_56211 [Caerostris darwini]
MIPSTQSSPSERDVSPKDMGKRFTWQRESSFPSGVAVSLCPPTPPLLVEGVGAEMNPWNLKDDNQGRFVIAPTIVGLHNDIVIRKNTFKDDVWEVQVLRKDWTVNELIMSIPRTDTRTYVSTCLTQFLNPMHCSTALSSSLI